MIPKVDTFTLDISEEIKRKEASLSKMPATNEAVQIPEPKKKAPVFLIVLTSFFGLSIVGLAGLLYFYFTDSLLPPSSAPVAVHPNEVPKTTVDIKILSPTLSVQIGQYVTSMTKQDNGYTLLINNYAPVFAYMTRNESAYVNELALLFPELEDKTPKIVAPVATTTEPVATTTNATSTATTTKVITKKTKAKTVATSTKLVTSTTTEEGTTTGILIPASTPKEGPHFVDLTLENQNMRVWTSGRRTLVYAFVGNSTVLISNTPAGILALKGAILH